MIPICIQEHVRLQALGFNPASINFDDLTLASSRYVCIRESRYEQGLVAIVDTTNTSRILCCPTTADAVILHPTGQILALRAGQKVQVFNLETRTKVKFHVMNETIKFWKWISTTTLALVTQTAVYHWSLEDDLKPVKIFERLANMSECRIINYDASMDKKWMVLVGILSQEHHAAGAMQLYSEHTGMSQYLAGHAAAFAEVELDGANAPTKLFAFAVRASSSSKLHIVEIADVDGNKTVSDIFFPADVRGDFPIAVQISSKYNIVYVITKYGYLHLYDIETGTYLYMNRLSGATIFTTAACEATEGFVAVNRDGQFFSTSVDDTNFVPYIIDHLENPELALKVAARTGLPGADELYMTRFLQFYQEENYIEAAKIAATSPRGILRTLQTIERLKCAKGNSAQIWQYFGIILENGKLNRHESIELVKSAVVQGRKDLVGKWIKGDKLEYSEELGDVIKPQDTNMACTIYFHAKAHAKAVVCIADLKLYSKIPQYAEKVGYAPDYYCLLKHLLSMDPDAGVAFATFLISYESGPLATLDKIVDVYMDQNLVKQATAFLLRALKADLPQHAHLQTRLLEMNLTHSPQIADAILDIKSLTHYDRTLIVTMCEKAGLYQRALELHADDEDKQRILDHSHLPKADRIIAYFESLSVKQSLASLHEMLSATLDQSLPIVIRIAAKYSDKLGSAKLIQLFESHKAFEGLYDYLGAVVNTSQDPEVIFRFIEAACKTGHISDVENLCRENKHLSSRGNLPIRELIDLADKQNHLKLLLPWLETKVSEGSKDTDVYNALAKIYIDSSNNPLTFLMRNDYYDPKTIGSYCEKRDPSLAHIAYKRGKCDLELIGLTNNYLMFEQQAQYLVKRCDLELWAHVLDCNNPYRHFLIDEVISIVPKSQDPKEVSVAVKAFMNAYLPNDLINLLEQIVLRPTTFADYSSLQNLLILTAIYVHEAKVMAYVSQLNNFDTEDVIDHAVRNGLFEEALVVHKAKNNHISAKNVLIEYIGRIDRAHEYAEVNTHPRSGDVPVVHS